MAMEWKKQRHTPMYSSFSSPPNHMSSFSCSRVLSFCDIVSFTCPLSINSSGTYTTSTVRLRALQTHSSMALRSQCTFSISCSLLRCTEDWNQQQSRRRECNKKRKDGRMERSAHLGQLCVCGHIHIHGLVYPNGTDTRRLSLLRCNHFNLQYIKFVSEQTSTHTQNTCQNTTIARVRDLWIKAQYMLRTISWRGGTHNMVEELQLRKAVF